MEEDAKDNGSPTAPESTDIQNYLSSFNKEIEDGGANQNVACDDLNKQDECYGIGIVPNDQAKVQYVAENEGILTGTAYFAAPDGTLYSTAATAAATGQGELGPQIAFLAPGGGTFANGSGVQQILLAVGDGTGLTTLDGKTLSFTVPVQISSQLPGFKSSNLELPKSAELPKSEENEPKGAQSKESVCEEPENDPEQESEGKEDSQQGENQAKPQPVVVVQQQPGQETVGQMLPIGTAGQAIISSLGNALQMSDQQAVQMVASIAEQAEGSGNIVASNSAAAVAPYQTIAIVPSETNSGELSYVLFMSPTKESSEKAGGENIKDEADDNDENIDLSIYDFQDGDNNSKEYMAVQAEDGSIRTIRLNHRKSQVVTQQHMCNYCNYTSPKRYLLSRHMKSHSDERPHKCSVCERGFKTLASLQNHVNTHTGTRPHACKDCNSCFTTSGELVRHIRYKHTHEKPHHCTECDYASVELSKLKRHMRCHTGERPYQCPHCTYASPDTYKLKRHLRIHTGEKPYKCDVCSARFTQSNSLKAHKLIHSGNKPIFHCQFCPATCGRKTDLRIHIQKLHSSDQLHRCKRCGKVFQDKYNFKLHTKSHEGEKCFKCDLCPYASITMRHLETHMLIHTDQKPFQCDQCDQSFRQKQLLRRHKNLYHNPDYVPPEPKEKNLVCSECNRAFRHKGNLIRHFAIHDPDATAAEREEAMRIGQPKEPGEVRDGEEDDYDEDTSDYNEIECGTDGNKQVVVFEVIQLSGNGPAGQVQGINTTTGESVKLEGENQAFAIIQQVTSEEKNEEEEMTFCELSNAECLPPSAVKLEVKDEACGESIIGSCSGIFPKESSLEEFEPACVTEAKVTSSCDETSHNIAQIITDNEQCSADGNAPAEENTRTSDGNDVESSAEQLCQEQEERGTASGFMVSQNDDDDDGEAALKIPDTE